MGLHPGIQANLANVTILFAMKSMPPWVQDIDVVGKAAVKSIIGRRRLQELSAKEESKQDDKKK
jgi:hypothetical protein